MLVTFCLAISVNAFFEPPQESFCAETNGSNPEATGYCGYSGTGSMGQLQFRCDFFPGIPGQEKDCVGNLMNPIPL